MPKKYAMLRYVYPSGDATFSSHRGYAVTYFDRNLVHNRAKQKRTDVKHHFDHLRAVLSAFK